MLFGRAPAKENIPLPELEDYLDRCFDGKARRLSSRMPEIEGSLKKSFVAFEKAIRGFSKSTAAPDMEYLRGLKETYLKSQMENYSTSLLHLLSSPPNYGGSCLYLKGKDMLGSYSSFITGVMKVNNTFKLVMIAYAAGLADTKRSFTEMERLCKDLGNELNMCLPEEGEYSKIKSRIHGMVQSASEIAEAENPSEPKAQHHSPDESRLAQIQEQIKEKEKQCEISRRNHREADSTLVGLLLPVERAARKHDHMSPAKVKLGEYLKDTAEKIRTTEDMAIIRKHLAEIADEIRTGKIEAKNSEGLAFQIDAIRAKDLLMLADASRRAAAELKRSESDLSELNSQHRALEKIREEGHRMAAEKTRTEHEIGLKREQLASEKKELERLFLSCYKKQLEIAIQQKA